MRNRWWIIPAVAALVAAISLGYWGYGIKRDRSTLLTFENNRNQRAYYSMLTGVQNMELMLSKGIISNSPKQRMMIFANIWQQAYSAQENLNQMPLSGPSMTRTSKFLTQTGDYAWSLARKYARGESVKTGDIKRLNQLHTEAGYLAVELQKLNNLNRLSWSQLRNNANKNLKDQQSPTLVGLQKLDKNMEQFPTLIYDGPFSDHITSRRPKALTGSTVNGSQAAAIAKKFADAAGGKFNVVKTEGVNGTIPAFRIHLAPQNAKTPTVITDISKTGGRPLSMLKMRSVPRSSITAKQAVSKASQFLSGQGIKDMVPTYMVEQNNTGVVIFEYQQNGVLIYPDMMKVKVALDNGEIIGFEGTGFVMNHYARKNLKPAISEKEASTAVNPALKVKSRKLALIPLDDLKEVLVYEFKGDLNGDTFIVYINAKTGEEERILKVIETRGGPVTM